LLRQAAHLCFGFIKDHPWIGGNKRTATMVMREFLRLNGYRLQAPSASVIELVLAVEADRWRVAEIEDWLRSFVKLVA
jgi:death on curing protein